MKRFLFLSLAIFLIPATVFGASIVRTGENVSIAQDQTVADDFYGLAESVSVSGLVEGDLLVASGDLVVNGQVGSDILALAGAVDLHGEIADDVRLVAGDVTVAGIVKGDLVVIASNLNVLPTAQIDGDIMFFGNTATVNGVVGGDILGFIENARIDNQVTGNVEITTSNLVLGDGAKIGGGITYTSFQELTRAQGAQVSEKIVKNDPIHEADNKEVFKNFLIFALIVSFTALVLHLVLRRLVSKTVWYAREFSLRSLLIGFAVLFLVPLASLILMVSMLGSVIGFALMLVYLVLMLISFALIGVLAGSYITKLPKDSEVPVSFILLGVFAVISMLYIPIVGWIVFIGLFMLVLGSLSVTVYRTLR